jgi:hypothetical protein
MFDGVCTKLSEVVFQGGFANIALLTIVRHPHHKHSETEQMETAHGYQTSPHRNYR